MLSTESWPASSAMMDEVGLDFKELVGVEFEDEAEDVAQLVEGAR